MEKTKTVYRFNYWNPLTWILLILAMVATPFISMFIDESVIDFYKETFKIIKSGMTSPPKKSISKFKIFRKTTK